MWSVKFAIVAGTLTLMATPALAAKTTPPFRSSVYCEKPPSGPGLKVFAYKIQPNGELLFGISIWYTNGQHWGLYSTAKRAHHGWVLEDRMTSKNPEEPCKLTFLLGADGSATTTSDKVARCKIWGGVGTELGREHFPARAREGAVTTELDTADVFMSDAGKCG